MDELSHPFQETARLYGIQTSYWDVEGRRVHATPTGLLRILQALGAPVERVDAIPALADRRRRQLWDRFLEPVLVAWDGHPPEVILRTPTRDLNQVRQFRLEIENGPTYTWTMRLADLAQVEETTLDGISWSARRLTLIGPYPLGYHRLTVECSGTQWHSTLLAAPMRPGARPGGAPARTWGTFIPLYALHSATSWGSGDFGDLDKLVSWLQVQGGGLAATLPLLAAFLDEPFEPSPYSPASRLFWNEFYLNLTAIPELAQSTRARELLASRELLAEVATLRQLPMVDYRAQMALKRRVLTECVRTLFSGPSARRDALEAYRRSHPALDDYARFRAIGERQKSPWQSWPTPLRDGMVHEGDHDLEAFHYHQYVQWQADTQLHDLSTKARATGPGLYLDLPLGVNASSYDVWRHRSDFTLDVAAGAPPDPFFAGGQNWGFPPLHPERIRENGYAYVRAFLHHHLKLAGILRIDHMMGLHRLYWIPQDAEATEGLYVGYRAEELYAVFVLEAHRQQAILVGEDLGTVPEEVPPMMARHDIHRMYVLQYQAQPHAEALSPVPQGAVASLNTHDMPPFAAFWDGLDIDDRVALGGISPELAERERHRRREICSSLERVLVRWGLVRNPSDRQEVLRGCLTFLGRGEGFVALANLEDFWGEKNPQNVPGTWRERPNWQRRARMSLEEMKASVEVLEGLRALRGSGR